MSVASRCDIQVQIQPHRCYDAPWSAFLIVYRPSTHWLLPPTILFVIRDPSLRPVAWREALRYYPLISWHLAAVVASPMHRHAHRRVARRLLDELEATYVSGAVYFLRAMVGRFPEDVRRAIWEYIAPRPRSIPMSKSGGENPTRMA